MPSSDKVALAAHLHVLLLRKTGRVTDIEWMAANAEYATEIVRFARSKAQEPGCEDLALWAGKLESAIASDLPPRRPLVERMARSSPAPLAEGGEAEGQTGFGQSVFGESMFADSQPGSAGGGRRKDPNAPRYVGGIR